MKVELRVDPSCKDVTVTVTDAQSVAKSWPAFFEDYRAIGGTAHVIDHR